MALFIFILIWVAFATVHQYMEVQMDIAGLKDEFIPTFIESFNRCGGLFGKNNLFTRRVNRGVSRKMKKTQEESYRILREGSPRKRPNKGSGRRRIEKHLARKARWIEAGKPRSIRMKKAWVWAKAPGFSAQAVDNKVGRTPARPGYRSKVAYFISKSSSKDGKSVVGWRSIYDNKAGKKAKRRQNKALKAAGQRLNPNRAMRKGEWLKIKKAQEVPFEKPVTRKSDIKLNLTRGQELALQYGGAFLYKRNKRFIRLALERGWITSEDVKWFFEVKRAEKRHAQAQQLKRMKRWAGWMATPYVLIEQGGWKLTLINSNVEGSVEYKKAWLTACQGDIIMEKN